MAGLGRVCSLPKLIIYCIIVACLIIAYAIFGGNDEDINWYYRPAPCYYPQKMEQDLTELASRINKVLTIQNIPHFACYGTLWGVLRLRQMLPWDPDLDICIMSDDLEKNEESYFRRLFRWYDVQVKYDSRNGLYKVKYGKATGELVLFKLSDDYSTMERIGWRNQVVGSKHVQRFPSRLISPPLPKLKLKHVELPVPREDIEIQKYLYPHDWWKEVKPPGC